MPTMTIHYSEDDTTPERVEAMAHELGITPEMLICRAVDEYLGTYGWKTPPEDFHPRTLRELFESHGLVRKMK